MCFVFFNKYLKHEVSPGRVSLHPARRRGGWTDDLSVRDVSMVADDDIEQLQSIRLSTRGRSSLFSTFLLLSSVHLS